MGPRGEANYQPGGNFRRASSRQHTNAQGGDVQCDVGNQEKDWALMALH
jgi:hypothetical protein